MKSLSSRLSGVGVVALFLLVMAMVPIVSGTKVSGNAVTSPSPVDSSNAVRYEADGSPIGDIVYDFIRRDDGVKTTEAPFPINFFGARQSALCLSTNGLIYPVASISSSCTPKFDKSVEILALLSEAPAIAALALDLDPAERIHNPHRDTVDELEVSSVVAASNVLTFMTTEPHGFFVGDFILRSFTPNIFGSCGFFSGSITSVPTSTSFTVLDVGTNTSCPSNPSPLSDGTYVPADGDRAIVFRRVAMAKITGLSLAGSTLTITTSTDSEVGVGRKVTLAGTGLAALDDAKLEVASIVSATEFTVAVSSGLTDVDASQVGDQPTVSFGSTQPWVLERDEAGAIQQVYAGSTKVNGRDAYAVTWYRMGTDEYSTSGVNGGRFPAVNPQTTSNTVQLLIIKRETGSDASGWDFDIEVNIGHATDASDGYSVDDPYSGCSTSDLSLCRWGIGMGRPLPGIELSSLSSDKTVLTVNTKTPHGLAVGQTVRIVGYGNAPLYLNKTLLVKTVVDADTFEVDWLVQTAFSDTPAVAGSKLLIAEAWELFPDNSVLDLRDAGGTTALVRNSLNSSVLGRYRFAMVGGQVADFLKPTMGAGVSGTPEPAPAPEPSPAEPAPEAPTTVSPAPTPTTPTTVASASNAPAPVLSNGALPNLAPGMSQVFVDGVPESVKTFVEKSKDLVLEGPDFQLRLAGECSSGCRIRETSGGRQVLTLEQRGLARVSGEGFKAGTTVYVWLFSEPRLLGELVVAADGTFSGSVPLGNVPTGEHTLQVNGTSLDGKSRTTNLGVVVNPKLNRDVIPATGSEVTLLWVMALVLLGGGLVTVSQRHRVIRAGR